jgi:adenylylsulfate kinase
MEKPRGWTIWLTGLPASGKTTLAHALRGKLRQYGVAAVVLDSDDLRRLVTPDPTYTSAERDWFYNRLIEMAAWLADAGDNVIISATGNRRAYRDAARARLAPGFAEVWARCPIRVCRARDMKGLYSRADAGQIVNLPGVNAVYEWPEAPEVVVDSDRLSAEEAADAVLAGLPFLLGLARAVGS